MKRRSLAAAAVVLAAAWGSVHLPIPARRLDPKPILSLRLTDRNGRLLREVLSDEGGRCRWVGPEEIPPQLVRAVIAAEDSRFPFHAGIDLYALARAVVQNVRHGRVVSGASTISQQVVRNIYRFPRSLPAKLAEAWLALRLEQTLTKEEILDQYLNRIAFGRQAYGIEAAARVFFEKPAADLSLSEAAFLAALPRAPSRFAPARDPSPILSRQRSVLRRMVRLGLARPEDAARALDEPLRISPAVHAFQAPHFSEWVLSRLPADSKPRLAEVRTTLDLDLQLKVESLLDVHLQTLEDKGLTNGAAIVLDNRTGEVLALAGSRDFEDAAHAGQVNGALALRQPGSTLKPLTYALALEKGLTAATLIDDGPTEFSAARGIFAPDNYDNRFHGPVRLRSALASSYNVPAVTVLELLGSDLLFQRLKSLGFDSLRRSPGYYGLGLTLGNGEVTLLELARAYAALARGGLFQEETVFRAAVSKDGRPVALPRPAPPRRVFGSAVAYIVTHILGDRDARVPSFGYRSPLGLPFAAAAKTGTSKDYRDNWTVGYTPRHTVAVWVGNFDGSPMHGISGVTGAGPLFRDICLALSGRTAPEDFVVPGAIVRTAICPLSGERPSPRCPSAIDEIFVAGTEPARVCGLAHLAEARLGPTAPISLKARRAVEVASPRDGDVFKIDPVLRLDFQAVTLRAALVDPGAEAVEWVVNGRRTARVGEPFSWTWKLRPGSYTIVARAVYPDRTAESPPVKVLVLS